MNVIVTQVPVTTNLLFDAANLQLTAPAQSVVDKLDDFQGKQDMYIISLVWLVNMTLVIVLEILKLTSVHPKFRGECPSIYQTSKYDWTYFL